MGKGKRFKKNNEKRKIIISGIQIIFIIAIIYSGIKILDWIKENNYRVIEYNEKARKNRKEVLIVNYSEEEIND